LRQIRWSLPAADDLERIYERIERDNPDAARRVAQTIYGGCDRLKDFPFMGQQPGGWAARTHLPSLHYIVVYSVMDGTAKARKQRALHVANVWLKSPVPNKAA
jgi:plasmid stabilization system protein ParE